MKKGFTLIELLAVIVILAVMALISVPLILGVIEDSKLGAFKDSVYLTFSSAELYEAQNSIPVDGIEVKNLVMKNNNFKYGKIIKNANNELEAVNVSDGRYCAFGLLTNITIYKGECDTVNPLAPTVSVENSVYTVTKEYKLSSPSTMSGIDSYEYYLSDTTDIPSSDVVISGSSRTNKITINKVSKYVFFRVISIANLKGDWTSAKTNYVDLTEPVASLTNTMVPNKSVTLSAVCSDLESGITKYEFSKDGTNYIDNGLNNMYTFNDIVNNINTYYVKCTNGANDKKVSSVEVNHIFNLYANGTAVYYNPVTGSNCTAGEAVSTPGTKTGCMKWYTFGDLGTTNDKINLLLDHNTTALVAWNSNGSNVNGPVEALTQLKNDTNSWIGVPTRNDSYTLNNGTANYTINYNTYKARLITADEISKITGNTSFNEKTSVAANWYFYETRTTTWPSPYTGIYAWLYNYTIGCKSYGCSIEDSSTSGFWTSTAVYGDIINAWSSHRSGNLSDTDLDHADYRGVRPVITIQKYSL